MDHLATLESPAPDPAAHATALVGHHYVTEDHYVVGREKIREYAKAVQDYHPAHHDEKDEFALESGGLLAPLTFVSPMGMHAQRKLLERIAVGCDLSQLIQTDQVLRFHRPIVAGDRLTCDVSLDSFHQVRGRDMLVLENRVSNQRDELVHTAYSTLFLGRRGETAETVAATARGLVAHDMSNIVPDRTQSILPATLARTSARSRNQLVTIDPPLPRGRHFHEVSVGEELPRRTIRLNRGDLVNYAGVSGDGNPIHWSDEFATLIGLDTVVAHGILTMGLGAGYITSWLRDPGAVQEYSVRFASPVYVEALLGATITFAGTVKSLDPDTGTAVIAMNATSNGRRVFGHRTAVKVRLTQD
ncbi:MaoC family dehydratase N-terminal domain-containing protein [Nocardia sp. CA2R105]|uniref:fused (3R)-hydroxyacyl-ACP dehydratase subunits HadA/HadB n=1 Tax=Nocardia coffeae TaxID=2873381 RepID=UPI001CA7978B|nr:fused (3R)-hydroxyacyl-ACP dehydratase subunits HadA/HadB [Nocardia coffeae]MBY8858463.1 MaoC family dehydratase N-terminal domain-containing protein [Nocardia coffeae]